MAYTRNTFNTDKDKKEHIQHVERIFHLDVPSRQGTFPIKSLSAFPNTEDDVKTTGVFHKTIKALDSDMADSVVKAYRTAARWACRGLAISKGTLRTGEISDPDVDIYRLRDEIRAKQVEIRNAELATFGASRRGTRG